MTRSRLLLSRAYRLGVVAMPTQARSEWPVGPLDRGLGYGSVAISCNSCTVAA